MAQAQVSRTPYPFLWILGSVVLVVATLYWAQKVLIPVALALLLTFILTPSVAALQRRGLGRLPAVLLVTVTVFALLGIICYVAFYQVRSLVAELPNQREIIKDKITSLQGTAESSWHSFLRMFHDIREEVQKEVQQQQQQAQPGRPEPLPVMVQDTSTWSFGWVSALVGPLVEILVSALLVIVLVIFMLIQREELRNRLLRLAGQGHVTVTTRALDEAGQRISRYLLRLLAINGGFGLVIALGLFLIGVQYAFLWGFLGMCLRFIPYIGPWLAAAWPITLSVASAPGWTQPLEVFGLFVLVEILISNAVEPRVFGQSIGVSEVALLIAAAFWAWLWGPLGLLLSTPLTACLIVLAKYVPALEFLDVLLGDQPVLEPHVRYYQRCLARDQDEATDLVEEFLESHPVEEVYDAVLLPALVLANREQERGESTREDERFLIEVTREILEDVLAPQHQISRVALKGPAALETVEGTICMLGCPARDEADELALEMFRQLLALADCSLDVLATEMLSAEVLARVQQDWPAVVCIAALPPGKLAHTRYLCKRLRAQVADLKIIVGRWGQQDNLGKTEERLRAAGADFVAGSLLESRRQVLPLAQTLAHLQSTAEEPELQPAGSS